MRKVLLLNATYEPIRVISVNRAIVLVYVKEKAEVITESDGAFHSERKTIPIPSVIRLRYAVQIPYQHRIKLTKSALIKRDNGLCGYCAKPGQNIDHIKPRSQGGKHRWENVVWACMPCNSKKANRTPAEAGMKLLVKAYAPKDRVTLILGIGKAEMAPEWETYLVAA